MLLFLDLQTPKRRKRNCGWVHSFVRTAPMSCEEISTDSLPTSGWSLRYGKKKQEQMNKCDVNAHAQARTKKKSKNGHASFLMWVHQGPPGFPTGPNTAEAVQRSRVSTGQELPTGLAPTQTRIWIHPRRWKGAVATEIPPDSTAFWLSLCPPVLLFSLLLSFCLTAFLRLKQADGPWDI